VKKVILKYPALQGFEYACKIQQQFFVTNM